jgi:hypothetical protein
MRAARGARLLRIASSRHRFVGSEVFKGVAVLIKGKVREGQSALQVSSENAGGRLVGGRSAASSLQSVPWTFYALHGMPAAKFVAHGFGGARRRRASSASTESRMNAV